jgi:hypothetical protein
VEQVILRLKREKQLTTHTLVPSGAMQGIDTAKIRMQRIILRELPLGVQFGASLWLIGDVLVHFSGIPPFAVAIRHPHIVRGMQELFQYLWRISSIPKGST